MNLRAQIMALPENERLDAALTLLDRFSTPQEDIVVRLMQHFGLHRQPARILAVLAARSPQPVLRADLVTAIWGAAARSDRLLEVLICRMRRKLPGMIATVPGVGYVLAQEIDMGDVIYTPAPSPEPFKRWRPDDVAELRRMVSTGSDLASIADELDRSEMEIQAKLSRLGLALRVAA